MPVDVNWLNAGAFASWLAQLPEVSEHRIQLHYCSHWRYHI